MVSFDLKYNSYRFFYEINVFITRQDIKLTTSIDRTLTKMSHMINHYYFLIISSVTLTTFVLSLHHCFQIAFRILHCWFDVAVYFPAHYS